MQMCEKCFRIYKLSSFIKTGEIWEPIIEARLNCINKNCDGILFEVDELFAPIMLILNKKGYKTKYCCSGHIKPDEEITYCKKYQKHYKNLEIHSYICFNSDVIIPNIPKGYRYDKKSSVEDSVTIRRKFNSKKTPTTLLREIMENTLNVLEWAEKLENKNEKIS